MLEYVKRGIIFIFYFYISWHLDGNIYITGSTESSSFPTTSGAYDEGHNGNLDVFVCKINSAGSTLIYSTLIGGSDIEYGESIAVDNAGCAYITGRTGSTNFPDTSGVLDTTNGGTIDAFVC